MQKLYMMFYTGVMEKLETYPAGCINAGTPVTGPVVDAAAVQGACTPSLRSRSMLLVGSSCHFFLNATHAEGFAVDVAGICLVA